MTTIDRDSRETAPGSAGACGGALRAADPRALPVGAHLVTSRRGYMHHGIHVGGGRVVHYAGLSSGLQRGPVKEVSLAEFAGGREVMIKRSGNVRYSGAEVAARARARIGEDRYRLISNNCEHLCEWCIRGESRSAQVEWFSSWPRRALSGALAALIRRAKTAAGGQPADSCAA